MNASETNGRRPRSPQATAHSAQPRTLPAFAPDGLSPQNADMHVATRIVSLPRPFRPREFAPPHALDSFLPLHVASLNYSSLLGSLHSGPVRSRRKRRQLDALSDQNDIVFVLETRGTAADMLHLPGTHSSTGTCFPQLDDAGTTRAGGTIVGIRNAYMRGLSRHSVREVIQGRAISVRLQAPMGL